MAKKDYWKMFEETGNINDYLGYRAELSQELAPHKPKSPKKKDKKVSGDDDKPERART